MRTIEKAIRTAHIEKKNWKQALYQFLRQYRATPHSTRNVSPSEALNNRKLKIPLPSVPQTQRQETQDPMRKRNQEKMKKYSDHRQHSKTTDLKIGDRVLIRQPKKNKLTPSFNPKPFTVDARKGTMVTVKSGSKRITRNISFFKKIDNRITDSSDDEDDDDDFDCDRTNEDQLNQEPARLRRSQRERRQPNRLGFEH
jgi:hypothetical protein